jgi:nucleotide-binding universal stress UspA family protein
MPRIVVGVDNSEGSRRALEWAVDEATRRGAHVEAVHVWHFPYVPPAPGIALSVLGDEEFEAEARRQLNDSVDPIDARALPEPIERVLLCDGTVTALLERAKGADLLVVGSRGRGGFAGLLLGSVSQEVSHHAPCPVVIVPTASDR